MQLDPVRIAAAHSRVDCTHFPKEQMDNCTKLLLHPLLPKILHTTHLSPIVNHRNCKQCFAIKLSKSTMAETVKTRVWS